MILVLNHILTDTPSIRLAGVKDQVIMGTRKRQLGLKFCSCEALIFLSSRGYIADLHRTELHTDYPKTEISPSERIILLV